MHPDLLLKRMGLLLHPFTVRFKKTKRFAAGAKSDVCVPGSHR
jgi:hypothetical protein